MFFKVLIYLYSLYPLKFTIIPIYIEKVIKLMIFSDDNVHYQQSMMLTRALEEADVLFQQLSYPDENHGIVGLRPHFYHSLSNFILNDCFGKNEVF